MNSKIWNIWGVLVVAVLFVGVSYVVQANLDRVQTLLDAGVASMIIYVLIIVLLVLFLPITSKPVLLPLAAGLWGWFLAGVLSIVGLLIGSAIAFSLSRKHGMKVVRMFISEKRIKKIEDSFPRKNVFWNLVFLKTILTVGTVSYFAGLFSKVTRRENLATTFLGALPMIFALSYLGTLPISLQVGIFIMVGIILIIFNWVNVED